MACVILHRLAARRQAAQRRRGRRSVRRDRLQAIFDGGSCRRRGASLQAAHAPLKRILLGVSGVNPESLPMGVSCSSVWLPEMVQVRKTFIDSRFLTALALPFERDGRPVACEVVMDAHRNRHAGRALGARPS